jgi:hypothetical protein
METAQEFGCNGDSLDGPGVDEGNRLDVPGLGDSEVVEFYGMDCLTLDVRSYGYLG